MMSTGKLASAVQVVENEDASHRELKGMKGLPEGGYGKGRAAPSIPCQIDQ
jgi:hypothetical protein